MAFSQVWAYLVFGLFFPKSFFSKIQNLSFLSYNLLATLVLSAERATNLKHFVRLYVSLWVSDYLSCVCVSPSLSLSSLSLTLSLSLCLLLSLSLPLSLCLLSLSLPLSLCVYFSLSPSQCVSASLSPSLSLLSYFLLSF